MHEQTNRSLADLLLRNLKGQKSSAKRKEDVSTDIPDLVALVEFAKTFSSKSAGYKFVNVANQINCLPKTYRFTIEGDDKTKNERVSNLFYELKRGNYPGFLPAILGWLWTYYPEATLKFFAGLGGDYIRLVEADATFKEKCDVFLCWSGPFANATARHIWSFLNETPDLSAFLSSNDLRSGMWTDELKTRAKESSQGLALLTQDALDSSYLTHDMALLGGRSRPITALLINLPRSALPDAVQQYQVNDFSEEALRAFLQDVFSAKDIPFPEDQFETLLANIDQTSKEFGQLYVTADEGRWRENLSRPLLMRDQNTSPFDLEQIMMIAQDKIVLVAQNHWFMTRPDNGNSEKFWELTKTALSRGVEIDIVGMHPDCRPPGTQGRDIPDAFDLWSLYLNEPAFRDHTKDCWDVLESWASSFASLEKEKPQLKNKLRFFGAYFTPVTISIVDPDSENGLLVMSARPPSGAAMSRPHLIIRRRYEEAAFKYYRQSVDKSFGNAGWRRMFAD